MAKYHSGLWVLWGCPVVLRPSGLCGLEIPTQQFMIWWHLCTVTVFPTPPRPMTFFTTHPFCARSINSGAVTLQICKHGTGLLLVRLLFWTSFSFLFLDSTVNYGFSWSGAWLQHTVDCKPVPALCREFIYFCRGHGAYYTVTKI